MNLPQIYVVTVNWNNTYQTMALLRSLHQTNTGAFRNQIVVVDNASSDDSPSKVAREFPEVDLLRLARNEGYAAAANVGIKSALQNGANYIWLLNNDTIVEAQTLSLLFEVARALDQPAILSPMIYYLDQPGIIWFAGGRLDSRLKTEHIGQGNQDQEWFHDLRKVDWVSGCAPFFSRQVVERVGLWPTEYFLYLEDVDWCLAAQEAGIECYVVGIARLWHDVSSSVNTLDPAVLRYYAWRNYYLLGRRRGRGLTRLWVEVDLWWCLAKSGLRWLSFPSYRRNTYYHARTHGLLDLLLGQVGIGRWPIQAYGSY